jgi:hypothetical protein
MDKDKFKVDEANSDGDCMYVEVKDKFAKIAIIRTDEGIVVDVYPLDMSGDGPTASTYAFESELRERDD